MGDCPQQDQGISLGAEQPGRVIRMVPTVAVIVLNWNGWKDTVRCLGSLVEHDYPRLSIVLVDNGSTDESVVQIKDWLSNCTLLNEVIFVDGEQTRTIAKAVKAESWRTLTLIVNRENLGFSAGNNIGFEHASNKEDAPDYVLFLNNDCTLRTGCIRYLINTATNNDGVAGGIQYIDGKAIIPAAASRNLKIRFLFSPLLKIYNMGIDNISNSNSDKTEIDVDTIGGMLFLINTELAYKVIHKFGYLWREDYFLYNEDTELSFRLKAMDIRRVASLSAAVDHNVSSSSGTIRGLYYTRRNRFHICRDHFNCISKPLCFFISASVGILRSLQQWVMGNRDISLVHIRATMDGLRNKRGRWNLHDKQPNDSH